MKYIILALLLLLVIATISTILGKYFNIKANPYEMRFNAKYEFMDFLRDHENNSYIFNNLLKTKYGLLILLCTIIIVSNIIFYIWIMGSVYFFGYFIHFIFFYQKQQPYVIDIQNFIEKANPTLLDCIKIIQKIAKSAAFTRFYKLLEFYYTKKKSNIQITKLLQTIIISWLLGYNYWCLCVIIDIALTVYIFFQKKNINTQLKIFIVHELSQKYMLSSHNPKELRIYWFNNSWVFNPPYLKTPLKLWDINHCHSKGFYVKHIGMAPNDGKSTLVPAIFFTTNPTEGATWITIKNINPNIDKQYVITNQLVKFDQLTEAAYYSKILKNCGLNNEFDCKLLYAITQFNSFKDKHTILNLGDREELIQKNINMIILDNDLSGYIFSDDLRKQREQLLIEKNNNSKLYEFCQKLSIEPLDIKNPTLKQFNIKQLLNFPMERYNFDSYDQ